MLFESALITVSILLALALDEWRETVQIEETIEQAMSNFLSEIRQNRSRVEDAAPFNAGLRDVLDRRLQGGGITTPDDFINIVESYTPVVLQSTAWETALATGSVTRMDYSLVSALSLTYGLQGRYQLESRGGMSDLISPQNLTAGRLEWAIYNAVHYLDNVNSMETELGVVYAQVEQVIIDAWMKMKEASREEALAWAGAP